MAGLGYSSRVNTRRLALAGPEMCLRLDPDDGSLHGVHGYAVLAQPLS